VFPTNPIAFVLAMASDKDHRAVVAELRRAEPKVAVFTSVPIAGAHQRSVAPGACDELGHWVVTCVEMDVVVMPTATLAGAVL
jgi:hypothetical protein